MGGQDDREQQAPPVQRLRIRYAKRGRTRFTSSRDFARAFERALRRADVPMAYSSGYSPHPRISYADAAPTGAASEAEYLEIGLREVCDPDRVRMALDAALPDGLDILTVVDARPGALADRLTGSVWLLELELPAATQAAAVQAFLAAESALVERLTKTGMRQFDARSAVIELTVVPGGLRLVLAHQVPLVRPDDVLTALVNLDPGCRPAVPPVLRRLQHGLLDLESRAVLDPLA